MSSATRARVLHLVMPSACDDDGLLACAAVLAGERRFEHDVLVIGNASDERRAASLGPAIVDRVLATSMPSFASRGHLGDGWAAARRAAAWLGDREASRQRVSIVQAWCSQSLKLAMKLRSSARLDAPVVLALTSAAQARAAAQDDSARAIGCGASGLPARGATVVARSEAIARTLLTNLAPAEAAELGQRVRVLPFASTAHRRRTIAERQRARAVMGLSPQQPVILWWSSSLTSEHACLFAFTLGLAFTTGHTSIGVVRRGVPDLSRASRFVRDHGSRWGLIATDASFAEAVSIADACVLDVCGGGGDGVDAPVSARAAAPMLLEMARQQQVPVLGVTDALEVATGRCVDGVWMCPRSPAAIARELIDLCDARGGGRPSGWDVPKGPSDARGSTIGDGWDEVLGRTATPGCAVSSVEA
jgi:hypothetical protein